MGPELLGAIFTTDEMAAATGDGAWLAALLDVEAALAGALADAGIAPAGAAAAIAAACDATRYDPAAIGRAGRAGGNPVIPLVSALRDAVGEPHATWVHRGATSQDIMDTAMVLVARRAAGVIGADLDALAGGCARLAAEHRATPMAGRTLLVQAVPVTFGLKAAGWLAGVMAAGEQLAAAGSGLACQLGGAAGTLAAYGERGLEVAARFAARTGLPEPLVPWHASRQRVAFLGAALAVAAGTAAKIAQDVALLMQTEVGEVSEPAAGGSSSMPHKRNPAAAAAVVGATRRVHAQLPVLMASLVAEHERDAGGWHSEWETLSEMLALTGGAVGRTAATVAGLRVHAGAMAANLARTGGLVASERVAAVLGERMGAGEARRAVTGAARRSSEGGGGFAAELMADPGVAAVTGPEELAGLLDPAGYLGSAGSLVDRVLDAHATAPGRDSGKDRP